MPRFCRHAVLSAMTPYARRDSARWRWLARRRAMEALCARQWRWRVAHDARRRLIAACKRCGDAPREHARPTSAFLSASAEARAMRECASGEAFYAAHGIDTIDTITVFTSTRPDDIAIPLRTALFNQPRRLFFPPTSSSTTNAISRAIIHATFAPPCTMRQCAYSCGKAGAVMQNMRRGEGSAGGSAAMAARARQRARRSAVRRVRRQRASGASAARRKVLMPASPRWFRRSTAGHINRRRHVSSSAAMLIRHRAPSPADVLQASMLFCARPVRNARR